MLPLPLVSLSHMHHPSSIVLGGFVETINPEKPFT